MERDDPAYKGQSGYNPFMLAIYDPWLDDDALQRGFEARAARTGA